MSRRGGRGHRAEDRGRAGALAEGIHPGDTQTVNLGSEVKLVMIWCPPGTFTVGSSPTETVREDDETQHRVTLTKGFWMG